MCPCKMFLGLIVTLCAYELKRGNPVGLFLAETLNGLDAFQRKEASFFARILFFFFKYDP